jgi:integrase
VINTVLGHYRKVPFVAVDNPHANRLTLHILAAAGDRPWPSRPSALDLIRPLAGAAVRVRNRGGGLAVSERATLMAEVFRPTYYVDPATGKRVNAGKPGAVKKKSPTHWIRYYLPSGERRKAKGYRDKKATETYAAELERRAEREHAGVIDPTDAHAKRPLAEHAEDFRRYLAAKSNTPPYVQLILFRLYAVLDDCRFVRVADVQAAAVVEFLARLRAGPKGKSVKTANEYLAAAKGFTRWLWRNGRVKVDPLAFLSKLANGAADVRHARRDLSPDELGWLLETTRANARPFRHLAGPDRYAIYLTAAATGFRTSELASMTPESFDLEGPTPTAKVQAACTKNRKEAVQPLPLDVAAALRDYLRGKPAGEPVWPGTWANDASAKMIRRDLADAHKAWLSAAQDDRQRAEGAASDFLAYRDAEGRYADFHGLRHTFITMIGKAGVSPKEHQDLARHSTYSLTGRYTHSRFYDLAAAVQALPIPLGGPPTGAAALQATGTDGAGQIPLGPNLGPQPADSGDFLRLAATGDNAVSPKKNPGNQADSADFQGARETNKNWRRRESNPRAVVPQRRHLRV